MSRAGSSSRCSAPRAAARPRPCASSAASSRPMTARCWWPASRSAATRPARHTRMVFQSYALFPHMTVAAQRRLWPADGRPAKRGDRQPRRGHAGHARPGRPGGQISAPALGRPAAARRAGARAGDPPAGPAARRAAGRARPQDAQAHAGRAQGAAARRRHYLHLRHARPGRGDEPLRRHRRHGKGSRRPDRHARGDLPPPGQRLRRRLRGRDQPATRARRGVDSRAGSGSRLRWANSRYMPMPRRPAAPS